MAELLWCWRHARVAQAHCRCIGRTDLTLAARQAKRLAHRIRAHARRHKLAREVWVSPLARCRASAQWLRRWGWAVHVDARLLEVDFGLWEGRAWADITWPEVQAWQHDLLHHAPGGGETLAKVALRAHAFAAEGQGARIVLTHGGWINALREVHASTPSVDAARWPAPPAPGSCTAWHARHPT